MLIVKATVAAPNGPKPVLSQPSILFAVKFLFRSPSPVVTSLASKNGETQAWNVEKSFMFFFVAFNLLKKKNCILKVFNELDFFIIIMSAEGLCCPTR